MWRLPQGVTGFCWMSLCFGVNHGTVSAMIPLAAGEFGGQGDWALGVLYAAYTLSAVCCGTVVVGRVGYRAALLWGCLLDSMFVVGMLGAFLVGKGTATSWVLSLLGGVVGGWASGFLWTAQGGYFTLAARARSAEINITTEAATSTYSGIFASSYLISEVLMKILSSLTLYLLCADDWSGNPLTGTCGSSSSSDGSDDSSHIKWEASVVTYSIFSVFSLVAALGLVFIPHYEEPSASVIPSRSLSATVKLFLTDPAISLLGGNNILFGLLIGFLNSYVTGVMVKDQLGSDKIGYFSAMTPLVAAVVGGGTTVLNNYSGSKIWSMLLGYGGAGYVVLTVLSVDCAGDLKEDLGTWLGLSSIFISAGIYRGVWEGTNKAVYADYYPTNPTPAFANVMLQSGVASSFSFIITPYTVHTVTEVIMAVFFTFSVAGYAVFYTCYKESPHPEPENTSPQDRNLKSSSEYSTEASWLLQNP